jgi:thiamine pyrophosphokinase
MRAVIVAHGDVLPSDRAAVDDGAMVIAADGGAITLERWKILPHLVVGDMDSLGRAGVERLAKQGVAVARFAAAKDESDLELAVANAVSAGATEITILGALAGDRLDHEAANLLLLADPSYDGVRLEIRRGALRVRPLRGPGTLVLDGPSGSTVTLLPVGGDADGVRTDGLRYPLTGETLRLGRSRGLSNEIERRSARVSLDSGTLLVFEIPQGGT